MKVHICSAHFGSPKPWDHAIGKSAHTVSYRYHDDSNTAARPRAMHPRLQAKIPKMLEWRTVEADWYLWLDSSVRISHSDIAAATLEIAGDQPLVLFQHPDRSSISDEVAAMLRSMRNGQQYLLERYQGEPLADQLKYYLRDPDFIDENLFWMGCFAYRRDAAPLMQEWFLQNILWTVQDQISFPYVLSKSGLNHALFPGHAVANPLIEWDWKGRDSSCSNQDGR